MSTVSGNHSITGSVLQVDAVTDGMGVFIRRSAVGNGNITTETITLALQTAANAADNFQVFGIEMVYVPQGNFIIGDGSSTYTFNGTTITAAIQASGIGAANAYQASSYGSAGSLPGTYPHGYDGFYCMKYEISQEQYASFLNSLSFTQQATRTNSSPASAVGTYPMQTAPPNNARNGIRIKTTGAAMITPAVYGCDLNANGTFDEAADGNNLACNWLSWADLMAYLDWSGLRPMTEFEYEKACRGPAPVVAGEYAWGITTILQAQSTALTNSGQGSEVSTAAGNGLCAYGAANQTTFGPLRCGFAAGAATTRYQAGATYYGIMEMTGNVAEQCIGGYNGYNYTTFTTVNGDGTLSGTGAGNTAGWPTTGGGNGGGGVARGGHFATVAPAELRLRNRKWMNHNFKRTRRVAV